jgi:hypothetical protein
MARVASTPELDGLALAPPARRIARVPTPALAVAVVCAAWAVAVVGGATGYIGALEDHADWLALAAPVATGLLVLLSRPHSPLWAKVALGATVTVAVAVEVVPELDTTNVIALIPVTLAVSAAIASRWPVVPVFVIFFLSGTFGTIEAYLPFFSAGVASDVLLAGGWSMLLWGWLTGRRETPRWLPLPLVPLLAYLGVTALYVVFSTTLMQSAYSFRASAWLMLGAVLVALLLTDERHQDRAHKAMLLVGAVVGGYALLRWGIGPSAKEEEIARLGGPWVLGDNNEVRLFGSLPNPVALGVWSAAMLPLAFASALSPMGAGWRLLGLVIMGLCGVALAGADSRAAMVGAAAGSATVLVLFAVGRGFEGRRALPLALGTIVLLLGGGVFAATKLADEGKAGQRFEGLLNPLSDYSVQDRLNKWKTVLDDVDELPFGHGLGASGIAEEKYARFTSAATFDPDSAYVKVAYDQGAMVMLLFIAALIALAAGLGQRAIRAPDARSGTLALAACGTLVSFSAAIGAGLYFEGLVAAAPWLIVGLGLASYVRATSAIGRVEG